MIKKRGSLGFLIFLFLFLTNCSQSRLKEPDLILIGIDGADWNNIYPFLNEGLLPNFKKLMKEGSYGKLKTFAPARSPVVWTSIATGKNMFKHGIVDWTYVNEKGLQVPYSENELKAARVWKILNLSGKRVGVINWMCTFPAEKVNGFIVSDALRHGVAIDVFEGRVTYPYHLLERLKPLLWKGEKGYFKFIKYEGFPDIRNSNLSNDNKGELKTWILQDKSVEEISLYLLSNVQVDFFTTYFRIIDVIGHYSARMLKKEIGEKWWNECRTTGRVSKEIQSELEKEVRNIFRPYFIYIDRVTGKFLKRISRKTTLIIVSDHGFGLSCQCYGHYCPDPPPGIIIMKGPNIKKNYEIKNASVYDITPTILYIYGMPVAKDMDGKVILEAFKGNFLKKRNINFVNSYENLGSIKIKEKRNQKLDKETLEQLRSLGYIK